MLAATVVVVAALLLVASASAVNDASVADALAVSVSDKDTCENDVVSLAEAVEASDVLSAAAAAVVLEFPVVAAMLAVDAATAEVVACAANVDADAASVTHRNDYV